MESGHKVSVWKMPANDFYFQEIGRHNYTTKELPITKNKACESSKTPYQLHKYRRIPYNDQTKNQQI